MAAWASTGINGLDEILCDLKKGDNVVWQVERIEDYRRFVDPYLDRALQDGRKVVYMRFARHEPIIENQPNVSVYQLDADSGFESFSTQVHSIISREGTEVYYIFDCLSDLLSAWATDLMVGNFFMVTCPYLFELDTIAYFAILRNYHSFQTIARIRETTQLLLDVYDFDGNIYIHPLKVWRRYSPTMFLPHLRKGEKFEPVTSSIDASRLLSHISHKGLDGASRALDYWDRLFMKADDLRELPPESEAVKELVRELCRIMVGRERRISELAQNNFSLEDLINIRSRLIGSGFIGGKAAGMLLAQNILSQDKSFDWSRYLEPHDSFYIGSDVFYSYIVENGWWKLLMKQKTKEGYFEVAPEMKENLLRGRFPDQVRERFRETIEYFGQSPIIVRSSSLLEDSFGNAFAGKYESLFLVNQGDPEQRYSQFEEAVRRVYASTMGVDALAYRLQRGLDQQDEQMALLVQRVSGSYQNHYFFPDLAGVGVSYNTFVWKGDLDPKAGMLRLVFGLGTRAVDRVEDDYPQTIALDEPLLHPYADRENAARFSQHNVDLLDTSQNCLRTISAIDLLNDNLNVKLDLIASPDRQTERKMKELGMKGRRAWILTFDKLLSKTDFPQVMQKMLKSLESHYQYPVDIEFTVNFTDDDAFAVNLVQCRPLQTKGLTARVQLPQNIKPEKVLFTSDGYTMGGSISEPIKRIVYVDPQEYVETSIPDKYSIARLIGKLNRQIANRETIPTMLFGPGRWGTTTPSLGVPVSFAEINKVSVLVEVAYEGGNLMPELSFGTHFFQDLVESDIFYVALFPQKKSVVFNRDKLLEMPNLLTSLLPEEGKFENVVKVCEVDSEKLKIMCDIISQKVVCFFT
ncbi:MAG: phosphoenolpyruvate synthase [Phycisphaerae bacterium]|nr:phosphoenolpyruvate synthase [Phycisphaerae bacterium]NIP53959.1 phosphoenolpyruvate synthase [Phycisphaerae bacterium]NIS52882.1 phosphoenolpyruvate synthase [Phycisphaerae bacterium]NIU10354.1 phosphoenolpyruvate synthase [Phycisphaerae bacterium]NIU58051.1 phosphoenolpyruvate synthase [Phycisphaerae bacterium]